MSQNYFLLKAITIMENSNHQNYFIIYFISAKKKMTEDELNLLLKKSRINNTNNNITGLLLYYDGSFAQVLEGEYEQVNRLYLEIQNDSRHNHIIRIKDGYHAKRVFSDWSMAFYALKSEYFVHVAGFKNFVFKEIFGNSEMDEKNPILIVLKSFFESQPIYRRLHSR